MSFQTEHEILVNTKAATGISVHPRSVELLDVGPGGIALQIDEVPDPDVILGKLILKGSKANAFQNGGPRKRFNLCLQVKDKATARALVKWLTAVYNL